MRTRCKPAVERQTSPFALTLIVGRSELRNEVAREVDVRLKGKTPQAVGTRFPLDAVAVERISQQLQVHERLRFAFVVFLEQRTPHNQFVLDGLHCLKSVGRA